MSNNGNLGYMTRDQWAGLDEENRTWYLYNAAILKCQDCQTDFDRKYEPKRSKWWTIGHLALISAFSFLGGLAAALLGFPIPGKH